MLSEDKLGALERWSSEDNWEPSRHHVRELTEEVRRLQRDLSRSETSWHVQRRDLIEECNALRVQLDEQTDAATLAIDVAVARRKAAKAWKRSAKRHRLVLETRWIESCVALKTDAITRERDLARDEAEEWQKVAARAVQVCDVIRAELDRVNARHMADADALLKERERADNLQGAINEFCEKRNRFLDRCEFEEFEKAVDELYRLGRESGFRPRWIAESEVEK